MLSIAIINENPEMMELLLEENIKVKDALLLAIAEEYVEGVELLLQVSAHIYKLGSRLDDGLKNFSNIIGYYRVGINKILHRKTEIRVWYL